jgi:hypothetical protein
LGRRPDRQYSLWVDCLLPSTQEARNRYAAQFGLFCLTRTHVKYSDEDLTGRTAH